MLSKVATKQVISLNMQVVPQVLLPVFGAYLYQELVWLEK
jgi:hypothetical protein